MTPERIAELESRMNGYVNANIIRECLTHISDLQAVVKQLPKCWRLNDAGERVQDVPVTLGMEVFWFWPDVPERDAVLKHEVMAIHQDGVKLRAVYHSTPGRGETPIPFSLISSTEAAARAANKAT